MIDRKENNNVKKKRWLSLHKCRTLLWIFCLSVVFLIMLITFYDLLVRADAHRQQEHQQKQEEISIISALSAEKNATPLANQDQRKTMKFGFSAKGGTSKVLGSFMLVVNL